MSSWGKKRSFFGVRSLCLSRACLGKMFVIIYKWLEKTVLTHLWHGDRGDFLLWLLGRGRCFLSLLLCGDLLPMQDKTRQANGRRIVVSIKMVDQFWGPLSIKMVDRFWGPLFLLTSVRTYCAPGLACLGKLNDRSVARAVAWRHGTARHRAGQGGGCVLYINALWGYRVHPFQRRELVRCSTDFFQLFPIILCSSRACLGK